MNMEYGLELYALIKSLIWYETYSKRDVAGSYGVIIKKLFHKSGEKMQ